MNHIPICILVALTLSPLAAASKFKAFLVNDAKVFSPEETAKLLERNLEPVDVARTLARTKNRSALFKDISYETLLSLNSFDDTVDCAIKNIIQRKTFCKQLDGSVQQYCNACIDRLKKACKSMVNFMLSLEVDVRLLRQFGNLYDNYVNERDLTSYPMELSAVDFVHSVPRETKRNYENLCAKVAEFTEKINAALELDSKSGEFQTILGQKDSLLQQAALACKYINEAKHELMSL